MSESTINALITAAGSIIGAIIGAVAKRDQKPSSPIPWIFIGGITGAILTFGILVLIGLSPLDSSLNSTMYDNFNKHDYDGMVNPRLWSTAVNLPNFVEQQNGNLTIRIEPKSGQVASLYSKRKLRLNQKYFVQARLVHSGSVGNGKYADTGVALATTDKTGRDFIYLCVINRNEFVRIWCEVYGRTTNGPEYITEKLITDYDVWHTVRIEVTPEMVGTFYIDENLMGSYQPPDAKDFLEKDFTVRLEVYTPEQDGILSHFDDVQIGRSK